MSEFKLHPLPMAEDYEAFFNARDDTVIKSGGALALARSYEYQALNGSSIIDFNHIFQTGRIALELEPKNEKGISIDPLMLSMHAFKRGMLLTYPVTDTIHHGEVTAADVRVVIQQGVGVGESVLQDGDLRESVHLVSLGKQGLALIGEAGRRVVHVWATDITEDEHHQRLFEYGAGVVLAAGDALITNHARDALDAHFKSPAWSQELDDILRPTTGE